MKNRTFIESICCAFRGLKNAIKQEKNFRIYILHILLTVPVNIYCNYTTAEWLIYAVVTCGVFAMECINTAIERICDYITNEKDEQIKIIKDIAAGAVLCFGISFYLIEIVLVVSHLCR